MFRATIRLTSFIVLTNLLFGGMTNGGFTSPAEDSYASGGDDIEFEARFYDTYFIGDDQYIVDQTLASFYLNDDNGDREADLAYSVIYDVLTDEFVFDNDPQDTSNYPNPGGNQTYTLVGKMRARDANMNEDSPDFSVDVIVNGD